MTGRARGRSRGRSRTAAAAVAEAQRPGPAAEEAPVQTSTPVGRGRTRGPQPRLSEPGAPVAPKAQPPVGPPTQLVEEMQVSKERRERQPRGTQDYVKLKPDNVEQTTGSGGSPVNLISNYYKLTNLPNFSCLYQYCVEFSPAVDSRGLRNFLLFKHSDLFGNVKVFDGTILFLPKKLDDLPLSLQTTSEKTGLTYTITLTLTNEWPLGSPAFMQLVNIIMRRILKEMKMQQLGHNYYSEERHIDLKQHNLQLWPGYATSIYRFKGGTMLCLDVSHKVLRLNTVLDSLYILYQNNKPTFHETAIKNFVGEIVMTRYNNKTYRIDDIHWNKKPTDTFELANGEKITFIEYYAKHYEKNITDLEQPLLVSKPTSKDRRRGNVGPIYLLPELCVLTGLTNEIRSDFRIMKDLANHTRLGPDGRARELQNFRQSLKSNEAATQFLHGWNIDFDDRLCNIPGRILPQEKLYQGGQSFSGGVDADWSRETRGLKLCVAVNLQNWALLCSHRDAGIANDFTQTLTRVCGPMGISVTAPKLCLLPNDRTDTYIRALKSDVPDSAQIVVCILSNNRKDRYDAIKKFCCVDRPVPSQCIVSRTLSKKQMLMSVCTKIGIQLNCKLGGQIWTADIPLKSNMVVGIDVYHDTLTKGKSIGGMVASLNRECTKYYSRCTEQRSGLEFIDGLVPCMIGALRRYNEENNSLPARIFVYRDGVGDGQLLMVRDHEMTQLQEAIRSVHPGYNPKFTMIVVKKRINTRVFFENKGSLGNPPPGTIVDEAITRLNWYDFFLVSQSVKQGTVSPTHYNVISDFSGLKPDHIQRLTYKLCHLYYNWPGTIRVPAPCQYAHKLAFLVGQSIHTEPSAALSDRLYYL